MLTTINFASLYWNDLFNDSIATVSYFWVLLVSYTKAKKSDGHKQPKRKDGGENRKSSEDEDVEGDLEVNNEKEEEMCLEGSEGETTPQQTQGKTTPEISSIVEVEGEECLNPDLPNLDDNETGLNSSIFTVLSHEHLN